MRILLVASLLVLPIPAFAQANAYRDPVAAELVARARQSREEVGRSISSYTAIVRHRTATNLRLPLRDRLIGRTEEAARIHWSREGQDVIQVLGSRAEDQDGVELELGSRDFVRRIFAPSDDRLYLPLAVLGVDDDDEEDRWGVHPLADGSENVYEYGSGDTLTINVGDRSVRAIQLNVFPRTASFNHFAATLWVEPETGAVVQASFRPSRSLDVWNDPMMADEVDDPNLRFVPGFLKDMEVDVESMVVQYSLWDLKHWLPRTARIEGYLRAGPVRVAFADETAYEIEEVIDDPAAPVRSADELIALWSDSVPTREVQLRRNESANDTTPRTVRVFTPQDSMLLASSDVLPPPIWERSADFITQGELEALVGEMSRRIPRGALNSPIRLEAEWGIGGPGLVRYNRVEGLSVGGRLRASSAVTRVELTTRLGTADLTPSAELRLERQAPGRTISLSGYHQLVATDPSILGVGNSIGAFFTGNDRGQYYRAAGARATLAPPAEDRRWYELSLFAERHQPLERNTSWNVARLFGSDREMDPNIEAQRGDVAGAAFSLTPWWGRSPSRLQAGVEYFGEVVAGDFEFVRSSLTLRATAPVGSIYRVAMETGAGTSSGGLPIQSNWFIGGSRTLRGYDPGTVFGSSFVRGRAEVSRAGSGAGLALFGDVGWAGDRDKFDASALLYSAGVGVTVLDGLMRFDIVRALSSPKGWGVELYLDALL